MKKSYSRSGIPTNTIHYTQPKTDNRFAYQKPAQLKTYDPSIELKGNLNITPKTTKSGVVEFDPFRKMNLKNLPDTTRTLVPDKNLETETSKCFLRSKSSTNLTKTNHKSFVSEGVTQNFQNTQIFYEEKKAYTRKVITNNSNGIFSGDNKGEPIKFNKKFNDYSKYNQQTQITFLPGGSKRNQKEIIDDQHEIKNQTTGKVDKSCKQKIETDFRSNISCLPSSTVRFLIFTSKFVS